MSTTTELMIGSITVDSGIQQRAAFNDALATEYSQTVLDWIESAPVTVFADGDNHWLADGFHRIAAVKIAGGETIPCNIIDGNKRDALLFATGANNGHGLRRSQADKRKAVLTLLNDAEWAQRSDRWIADQAKVSHPTVSTLRGQLVNLPVEKVSTESRAKNESTPAPVGSKFTAEVSNKIVGKTESTPAPVGTESRAEVSNNFIGETESTPAPIIPAAVTEPVKRIGQDGKARLVEKPNLIFTVEEWNKLSAKDREFRLKYTPATGGFNESDSGIEWARWSWNPITGCEYGCKYCYARDQANRHYSDTVKFKPALHLNRIQLPRKYNGSTVKDNNRVFTCSMSDLFGHWIPDDWINAVLNEIQLARNLQFLLLTKNPKRLLDFQFPHNAWVGTTCDNQQRMDVATEIFKSVNASVKWVSVEPMLEPIVPADSSVFDWYVIGGASKTTQQRGFIPPFAWVVNFVNALGDQPYFLKDTVAHRFPKVAKKSPTFTGEAIPSDDAETSQLTATNGVA